MTPEFRVHCTRQLPGRVLERLRSEVALSVWEGAGAPDRRALREAVADADGLLCMLTDRVDESLLAAAPRLRAISSMSVGLDHVDLGAASRRGIPVGHTPGVLAETTADLAFALLLASARRLVEADRWLRDGGWTWEKRWDPEGFLGPDLHGATLGVVGLGAIGRAVARRAEGFGMRVLGWSRSGRGPGGVEMVTLPRLLGESDFVTLHVALADETRGLLDAEALALMKPGSVLVNTSRGGIVDEQALVDALEAGRLAAAGLDVFEREPLDLQSPLLRAPNLTLTPHIGSASVATRIRMADLAVGNLLEGLAGRPMLHCANPEVGERERS